MLSHQVQEHHHSLSLPKRMYAPHLCGPLLVVGDCLRLRHTSCKRTHADGQVCVTKFPGTGTCNWACSNMRPRARSSGWRPLQQGCSSLGDTYCAAAGQRSIHDSVLQLDARHLVRGEQLVGVRHSARLHVCGSAAHHPGALAPGLPGRAQERAHGAHPPS